VEILDAALIARLRPASCGDPLPFLVFDGHLALCGARRKHIEPRGVGVHEQRSVALILVYKALEWKDMRLEVDIQTMTAERRLQRDRLEQCRLTRRTEDCECLRRRFFRLEIRLNFGELRSCVLVVAPRSLKESFVRLSGLLRL
jgi:hypothetical protein